VTEITKSDVARFLDFVAEGRPRPCKAKPNNRARKLQGHKPTPIRANRMGEVLRKMFTLAMEWVHPEITPPSNFHHLRDTTSGFGVGAVYISKVNVNYPN